VTLNGKDNLQDEGPNEGVILEAEDEQDDKSDQEKDQHLKNV
jgi:hypothetical protein